jgi:hypothetical protein
MSTFYKESNFESTKMLFSKGRLYDARMRQFSNSESAVVDFNLAEKFLYGRVDRHFVPIVFVEGTDIRRSKRTKKMKYFNKTSQIGNTQKIGALNFVVDAFNDLEQQFRKCAAKGLIDAGDKYLSKLVVHRAYENPLTAYKRYRSGYFSGLQEIFKKRNVDIMNFEDFVEQLKILVQKTAITTPFTFPAFVKSRRCPINVSGLVVEIADLKSDNDDEKIKSFVNSPNWKFYLNACRTYGFMVDKSRPWRLVADIGSSAMLKYAARYGPGSTGYVLANNYGYAHNGYFSESYFKRDLLELYNSCVPKNKIETEYCNGSIIVREKRPQRYASPQFMNQSIFLELYFDIRFMEEESEYTDSYKNALKKDCTARRQTKGRQPGTDLTTAAIDAFERIINKTFDYRGSLTYNNNIHLPAANDDYDKKMNGDRMSNESDNTSGGGY